MIRSFWFNGAIGASRAVLRERLIGDSIQKANFLVPVPVDARLRHLCNIDANLHSNN